KSGATRTRNTAQSGASRTARSARTTRSAATSTAKTAGTAAAATAKSARSGARGTASAARAGTKDLKSTAKGAATRTRRTSGGDGIVSVAEQLVRGAISPRDVVMLTRDRIQETLDEAASRGRVTRKDANELVAELVRRGRSERDELVGELETLLEKGRGQLGSATKDSVDRVVRVSDRARRTVGVGPSFPILGYDSLNVSQVRSRLKDLKRPELRKVLNYERKHANRKSVVGTIEKSLA
ncbi:MAG TPA: hypothetical protein VE127_09260, partial [Solirubrobacteraceae bacterium]|nr:hypothetical protein [Solirubrobacteraceae bacterium]